MTLDGSGVWIASGSGWKGVLVGAESGLTAIRDGKHGSCQQVLGTGESELVVLCWLVVQYPPMSS